MEELLADIDAFLARHEMAPSTFGAALNDRHFVRQLRAGRRVWPETEARVRNFMAGKDALVAEMIANARLGRDSASESGSPESASA